MRLGRWAPDLRVRTGCREPDRPPRLSQGVCLVAVALLMTVQTMAPIGVPTRPASMADADSPPPSTSVSAEDSIEISPGMTVTLHPAGAPWGRIELVATHPLEMHISISHANITDLSADSDDGEGIYDERHFTFIRIFREDGTIRPQDTFFEWWGAPNWSLSPLRGGPDSWTLDAGEALVVLVANNVDGYNITLTANEDIEHAEYIWNLGPREGFNLFLPESEDTLVDHADVRVRQRRWEASAHPPPSRVKARSWAYQWTGGPETTVFIDHLDAHVGAPIGVPTFGNTGTWQAGVEEEADGGTHKRVLTITRVTTQPIPVWFHRFLHEAEQGVDDDEHGAAFMTIPWTSTEDDGWTI